jgi:hypothetical protein
MLKRTAIITATVAVVFAVGPAPAATKDSKAAAPPAALARVTACRSIAGAAERLACFDREVAAMATAQAKGDLVAMDRQQVRRTKRSLFGLALPDLGVFGDSDSIEGDATTLETTIKRVVQNPDGKYIFTLAEGGRWQQLDSRNFIVDPAPGQTIRIRQAAMGSYLANVNKQNAIRVRRIQ